MKPTPRSHVDDTGNAIGLSTVKLSAREFEIVRQIASGQCSKEIAVELGVSLKTVESHRTNLFRKLGFRCVADVVRYAVRQGLIEP
jgi:DNA-binding NarL/FixJ family response regulator